jgi:hypothetical protein
MPNEFTSEIDTEWNRHSKRYADLRKLASDYDAAILGVALNGFGRHVFLYSADKLFDLFFEELQSDESLDDFHRNDRCSELVSLHVQAGEDGDGDPLIVDGPFEKGMIEEAEACCRYYTINGEHWRGELLEEGE